MNETTVMFWQVMLVLQIRLAAGILRFVTAMASVPGSLPGRFSGQKRHAGCGKDQCRIAGAAKGGKV